MILFYLSQYHRLSLSQLYHKSVNNSTTFGSSNPSTRRIIENGSMEIRKKLGAKKAEKSLEISAFLSFYRSDLNRPKDMAGAEGRSNGRRLANSIPVCIEFALGAKGAPFCKQKRANIASLLLHKHRFVYFYGALGGFEPCPRQKNRSQDKASASIFGRGGRTRTHDPWFWRPVLYQLSYTPTYGIYYTKLLTLCQDVFRKKLQKFDNKIKLRFEATYHTLFA